jgi:hypothetical protein
MPSIAGAARSRAFRFLIFPLVFYALFLFVYTYPRMLSFGTHVFSDRHDGLSFVWNLWWVDHAVTELHRAPWSTTMIYYPEGMSLLPHTMSPLNGFLAVGLLRIFPLDQTYNVLFLFGFLGGGLFMFFLAWDRSRSYWGSLGAGFLFTFSSYHFAHAMGHLNLVALQWMPLFVLFFLRLLEKPKVVNAALAALFLFATALTDYYYAFYMVLLGLLLVVWEAWKRRDALFAIRKTHLAAIVVFILASLASTGVLFYSLAKVSAREAIVGHSAANQSLDLFDPVVWGPLWKFSSLTKPYWTTVPRNPLESNVHLGLMFLLALALVAAGRKKFGKEYPGVWLFSGLLFGVLALGPRLHVLGRALPFPMPYGLLEAAVPALRISGVPARMIVVTLLAGALAFAMGYSHLMKGPFKGRAVRALFIVVLFIELFPQPTQANKIAVPDHVRALKEATGQGAALDLVDSETPLSLYYQSVHGKPLSFGFTARTPARLIERKQELLRLAGKLPESVPVLRERFGVRWIVAPKDFPGTEGLKRIGPKEGDAGLFELGSDRP